MRTPILGLRERRAEGQHPGLLLTRFLAEQNDEGRDKRDLFHAARAAARDPSLVVLYRHAFNRWQESLVGVKAVADLATPPHNRLIVGLGNKGTIEAGLRLHHTYGVPLILGSALKGLSSHYCHEVYGPTNDAYRRGKEYHNLLFGKTDDGGVIRFEDAWMHPDSLALNDQGLLADVMTPHHQKWQTEEEVAPTDFDSPVPVPFLSVAGRFHVAVCWHGPDDPSAEAWTKRAMEILKSALGESGVGGKTTSGYGRLADVAALPRHSAPPKTQQVSASTAKRASDTPARVMIVAARPKGGFDVQEAGRPAGTLTLGTPPAGITPEVGAEVDVLVHVDDPKRPQYKWPVPGKPTKPSGPPPRGRR